MLRESIIYKIYDKSLIAYLYRNVKKKMMYKRIRMLQKEMRIENYIINNNSKLNKSLKLRIIFSYLSAWNGIQSLYYAFHEEDSIDVCILVLDFPDDDLQQKINRMEEIGAKYKIANSEYDDYDIEKDKPDILIVTNPFRDSSLMNVANNCKFVAVASFTLIDYSGFVDESYWEFQLKKLKDFRPDLFLFDALLYADITSKVNDGRIELAGNVKYDDIYNVSQGEYDDKRWPKLKGKKVILYATTHGITNYQLSELVSFDVYWKTIIEYMKDNPEMGLIFRPHPVMMWDMEKLGLWTRGDYMKFRRFIQSTENIVFDDSSSYNDAYGICDAIMTDAYCGVCASALPLGKPIGLLYRHERLQPVHEGLDKALYPIRNKDELLEYMDNVKHGRDAKWEKRKAACEQYVLHFDGNNGRRMKELILKKYKEKGGKIS